ncbi:hypothetical protein MASR2M18_20560 [Ignavibacteria bacterium]|nr:T9SS type A sorting domain-containing protein [Bacteroidota bacterium]
MLRTLAGRWAGLYYTRPASGSGFLCSDATTGVMTTRGSGDLPYASEPVVALSDDDKCQFMKLYCPTLVTVEEAQSTNNTQIRQPYPNPTSYSVTISFSTKKSEHITISVFNQLGQKAALLTDADYYPGEHIVTYDMDNLPYGVYWYQIVSNGNQTTCAKIVKH